MIDESKNAKRRRDIIHELKQKVSLSIREASREFGVSENTIRRDFTYLAENDLIIRMHGGAVLKSDPGLRRGIVQRRGKNSEAKAAIGREAVKYVTQGDTIIVDGGTTCLALSKLLIRIPGVTIITSSLEVFALKNISAEVKIVATGGIWDQKSNILHGLPAEQFLKSIHAAAVFLSTTCVDGQKGFSINNFHEVPLKRAMIKAARRRIVLVDSSKMDSIGTTSFASFDEIDHVITDQGSRDYTEDLGALKEKFVFAEA